MNSSESIRPEKGGRATDGGLSPVKRALVEIRGLKRELEMERGRRSEPIAIVGMGVRTPGGVDSVEGFKHLLFEGIDAVGTIPAERWPHERFYSEGAPAPGKYYVEEGGFLERIEAFDPEFFGIAPLEAATMDPQQRLLLETAWESLEHAGIPPTSLRGSRTGVFLGIGTTDYHRAVLADPDRIDAYASTGTAFSVASGRIAYLLGLHGPAVSVDTACSSSLVALHLACQSLRGGESDLGLVAGVSLMLSPEVTVNFCQAGMLSRVGRCKTFDGRADGYVRSEGCGVVVLKRLADARRDGDRILAVVRGSAVNQDGRSSGLTAPSGPAQESVIRAALGHAGIGPSAIGYVEAHGTATPLGDPIEMEALGAVFSREDREHPLLVGSVKTNLGHLEAAAGIAGLIKAVLALEAREIPPHLHFEEPNPHIDWERLRVEIPTTRRPLAPTEGARRVGVSSFGFSGTNAHVVLEEAPQIAEASGETAAERSLEVLALSAPNEGALQDVAARYVEYLGDTTSAFPDICHTAATGRTHFDHRLAIVARDGAEARRALEGWLRGESPPGVYHGSASELDNRGTALLFPWEVGHAAELIRGLREISPLARRSLDRCAELMPDDLGRSILEPTEQGEDGPTALGGAEQRIAEQFATQYTLARLWKSWGMTPHAVVGVGTGEIAAACIAGAFDLDAAAVMAKAFGRALDLLGAGGRRTEAEALIQDSLGSITFSRAGEVGYYSARARESIPPENLATAEYWAALLDPAKHQVEAVRAASSTARFLVVVGGEGVRYTADLRESAGFASVVPDPFAGGSPWPELSDGLARLYAAGGDVKWREVDAGIPRRRVTLPTYPFQRRRIWLESGEATSLWLRRASEGRDGGSSWDGARDAALERSEVAPIDVNLASYGEKWAALAELSAGLGRNALAELGAFSEEGTERDLDGVLEAAGIGRLYAKNVGRWLEGLADEGALQRTEGGYRAPNALATIDLEEQWGRVEAVLADDMPLLRYVRNAGALLPGVLSGRTSPLETLFPDGDFELASDLYQNAGVLRYVNGIAKAAVQGYVRGLPFDRAVRVLEVGAGTGGTTSSILSALPEERASYDYTDVSDAFLDWGARKYSDVPFFRTRLFDLEQDPRSQEVESGTYDIVVGSNVFHAARDLRATLKRVRSILAPGGLLLLVESTGHHAWHDFTTGLIEGWQHFHDDLRTDTPLLPVATWRQVLSEAGFAEIQAAPAEDSPAGVLKQHVILALAPRSGARAAEAHTPGGGDSADSLTALESVSVEASADEADEVVAASGLAGELAGATRGEREELVMHAVRECVMEVLRADPGRPPSRDARLMELGVDSLMAVRLRNLLERRLGMEALPSTLVFDYPTIRQIGKYVMSLMGGGGTDDGTRKVSEAEAEPDEHERHVSNLSDEEVEALLLDRLDAEDSR